MPTQWESSSLNTQTCPGLLSSAHTRDRCPHQTERDRGSDYTMRSLHRGPARIQRHDPGLPHSSEALCSATCLCLPPCLLGCPCPPPQQKFVLITLFPPGLNPHPGWGHFSHAMPTLPAPCPPKPCKDKAQGEVSRCRGRSQQPGPGRSVAPGVGIGLRDLGLVLEAPASLHPQGPARQSCPRGTHLPCRLSLSPHTFPAGGVSSLVSPRSDPLLGPIITASSS